MLRKVNKSKIKKKRLSVFDSNMKNNSPFVVHDRAFFYAVVADFMDITIQGPEMRRTRDERCGRLVQFWNVVSKDRKLVFLQDRCEV